MNPPSTSRLDHAVESARALRVGETEARDRARELLRWAPAAPAPSRLRWAWPSIAIAATAAAIVGGLLRGSRETAPAKTDAIQVGERVAIVAAPGSRYTVRAAGGRETVIDVSGGAVTARLYSGEGPHELRLRAGSLTARATGTIYSVAVPASGEPYAVVHRGSIEIDDPGGRREVTADPGAIDPRFAAAVRTLEARPKPPPPAPTPTIEPLAVDAAAPPIPIDATAASEPPAPVDLAARWHEARALRAAGKHGRAQKILAEMIGRDDPVWSPIALAESMRLREADGERERVIELGDRFLERYPTHQLLPEVRELWCAAHSTAPPGCAVQ